MGGVARVARRLQRDLEAAARALWVTTSDRYEPSGRACRTGSLRLEGTRNSRSAPVSRQSRQNSKLKKPRSASTSMPGPIAFSSPAASSRSPTPSVPIWPRPRRACRIHQPEDLDLRNGRRVVRRAGQPGQVGRRVRRVHLDPVDGRHRRCPATRPARRARPAAPRPSRTAASPRLTSRSRAWEFAPVVGTDQSCDQARMNTSPPVSRRITSSSPSRKIAMAMTNTPRHGPQQPRPLLPPPGFREHLMTRSAAHPGHSPTLIRSVSRPPAISPVSSTTPKITFTGKAIRNTGGISTEPARAALWKCAYTLPEIN